MLYPSPAEICVFFRNLLDKVLTSLCPWIVLLLAGAETSKKTDNELIRLTGNNPKLITPRGRK